MLGGCPAGTYRLNNTQCKSASNMGEAVICRPGQFDPSTRTCKAWAVPTGAVENVARWGDGIIAGCLVDGKKTQGWGGAGLVDSGAFELGAGDRFRVAVEGSTGSLCIGPAEAPQAPKDQARGPRRQPKGNEGNNGCPLPG